VEPLTFIGHRGRLERVRKFAGPKRGRRRTPAAFTHLRLED
jgi:hypothetical protein